jgi:hypothetical protein
LCRNCLLKKVIEGKIEGRIVVTEKWRRRKQLVDGLKERGEHWKLKEEALDRSLWRTGCGRGKILKHSLTKVCNTKIVTGLSKYIARSKQ